MMNYRKLLKGLVFGLIATMLLIGLTSCAQEPDNTPRPHDPWGEVIVPPGGTINLAFVSALTGDWAAAGESHKNAVLMAIEDVDTIKGFSVSVHAIVDSGCDPEMSELAAKTVTSDSSIVGVVGPWCSWAYEAAAPIYEGANLVVISPGAMMAELTEGESEVFNRVVTRLDRAGYYVDRQVVNTSEYQEFASRYLSIYGEPIPKIEWDGDDWGYQAAFAYDAACILIHSIEQVAELDASGNLVIGRQNLASAVRVTSEYQGVTGEISFDEKGDRLP
jgi:ABC-type branched-subunit amino acid transport system substrate-binding protein